MKRLALILAIALAGCVNGRSPTGIEDTCQKWVYAETVEFALVRADSVAPYCAHPYKARR